MPQLSVRMLQLKGPACHTKTEDAVCRYEDLAQLHKSTKQTNLRPVPSPTQPVTAATVSWTEGGVSCRSIALSPGTLGQWGFREGGNTSPWDLQDEHGWGNGQPALVG